MEKLGYTKTKKYKKQQKRVQKLKQKGKWSKAAKEQAHRNKTAKKWRAKNQLKIYRKRHVKEQPKIHFSDCPACNPNSNLTWQQYVIKVHAAMQDNMLKKTFQQTRKVTIIRHKRKEQSPVTDQQVREGMSILEKGGEPDGSPIL